MVITVDNVSHIKLNKWKSCSLNQPFTLRQSVPSHICESLNDSNAGKSALISWYCESEPQLSKHLHASMLVELIFGKLDTQFVNRAFRVLCKQCIPTANNVMCCLFGRCSYGRCQPVLVTYNPYDWCWFHTCFRYCQLGALIHTKSENEYDKLSLFATSTWYLIARFTKVV